jgi:hypothetical protein
MLSDEGRASRSRNVRFPPKADILVGGAGPLSPHPAVGPEEVTKAVLNGPKHLPQANRRLALFAAFGSSLGKRVREPLYGR